MKLFLFAAVCSPAAAHFNIFPDGDLKELRQPVQALNPIDHINSNDVLDKDADGCPDLFVAGTSYEEGDLVELNTVVYKCKSWPYAPWCSKSGYEPDGDNSDKAWEVIGHCEEELIDPVVPSVVKVENERMLETTLPGCPALHNPSNTYAVGDQVSITSGQSSIVYQCDNGTNCNQNSPGSGPGWTLVGYCEGTIAPTSSPTTAPTTGSPTKAPTTGSPSKAPTTGSPTKAPTTGSPTKAPTTGSPTKNPITNSPTAAPVCASPFNKIKIQATTTTFIQFYELQVISGGTNVAVNKAASQSSTINPHVASRGVDGSSTTFSHTNEGSAEWFQVDLGATATADRIVILNRDCGNTETTAQCLCRMSNANLIFMDASNNQVATSPLGNTCGKDTITTFTQCS
jgi:hypothetical protein